MAEPIASPRMTWRVLATSRIYVLVSCEVSRPPSGDMSPVGNSIESKRERAVAFARCVAVYESTATLVFHSSKMCSGMGYRNMETRGG